MDQQHWRGADLPHFAPLDSASPLPRIIEVMRWIVLFASLAVAAGASAQQAIPLPPPPAISAPAADTFHFVSDGPAGPGWNRPDEIARKYFRENLTALFERTLTLDAGLPQRATLRWIFTGPRAGLTVELTSNKIRISERYYDSMALYEGQGNFPEKTTFADERQFTGDARTLTVIADAHLAVRVLVNGQQIIEAPLLFDLTRHQLMLVASRTAHLVVSGSLLKPDLRNSTITINASQVHQTMLGFGGSPSIPAYAELSDEGKRAYWQILKRYNLLLSREYPMGTQLKPDLSNLEDLADATPHYYGDNFPNSELSSFEYSRHVLDLGGSVIYELWALPSWATVPHNDPYTTDTWNKPIKQVANPDEFARLIVTYCKKAQAATGSAPAIVGIQNEFDQPPEIFSAMALALRRELDKAGFTATKIHMADASYMFLGIDRATELRKNPEAWKAIDYAAVHEYDFQEFLANLDLYDARMKQMHEAANGKPFLATEICINDPHFQEPSYRIAFAVAQLYHKNLTELDAVALMYCWLLLDVEQPTFAGSRSLLAPDRARGWIPVPTSYQLRVMGAFSRHIVKGMQRVGVDASDADLLTTAFADAQNETLVVINRSATARKLTVEGANHPWVETERTGPEEENAVVAVPAEVVVEPGEIVVLSTIKAE
jgi:O-glycosyl hydrolase